MDVEEPREAEKSFQSALEILALEPVNKYNISLRLNIHNILGKSQCVFCQQIHTKLHWPI